MDMKNYVIDRHAPLSHPALPASTTPDAAETGECFLPTPTEQHAWRLNRSIPNPCGCARLAAFQLASYEGELGAVYYQAGASNRTLIHQLTCERCLAQMLVIENKSGQRTWIAQAYQPTGELEWVGVAMTAEVAFVLGLGPSGIAVWSAPDKDTKLCCSL